MTSIAPRTLVERSHDNFVAAYVALASAIDSGFVRQVGPATMLVTGIAEPEFNRLFVFEPVDEPLALLQEAAAAFAARRVPWMLVSTAEAGFGPVARFAGLHFARTLPGMAVEGLERGARPRPALEVRPVVTPTLAELFVQVLAAGFNTPRALFTPFGLPGVWQQPDYRSFVGFLDGEPVATATCVTHAGIAGIYNVATVPAARRQGLAEAMTRHAVAAGIAAGCTAAALQASAMGRPLYRRMGFRPSVTYSVWYARTKGADPAPIVLPW